MSPRDKTNSVSNYCHNHTPCDRKYGKTLYIVKNNKGLDTRHDLLRDRKQSFHFIFVFQLYLIENKRARCPPGGYIEVQYHTSRVADDRERQLTLKRVVGTDRSTHTRRRLS